MRAVIAAFAVTAGLAITACTQPYGYGPAGYGSGYGSGYGPGYGGVPAYGYGEPGGYAYGGSGYGYGGPGYGYAPPPYAYGAIVGEERNGWQHDDRKREDWHGDRGGNDGEGSRAPDQRRVQGAQFGGGQRNQQPRAPQQRQNQQQGKERQDVINELRAQQQH